MRDSHREWFNPRGLVAQVLYRCVLSGVIRFDSVYECRGCLHDHGFLGPVLLSCLHGKTTLHAYLRAESVAMCLLRCPPVRSFSSGCLPREYVVVSRAEFSSTRSWARSSLDGEGNELDGTFGAITSKSHHQAG